MAPQPDGSQMRPAPSPSSDDRTGKVALFLTREQIRWLTIGLGALPRTVRKPLERELDRQLSEHAELNS
jgi:hypothetical protein